MRLDDQAGRRFSDAADIKAHLRTTRRTMCHVRDALCDCDRAPKACVCSTGAFQMFVALVIEDDSDLALLASAHAV